jgi:Ca2+-binding RTX toxin-like protein
LAETVIFSMGETAMRLVDGHQTFRAAETENQSLNGSDLGPFLNGDEFTVNTTTHLAQTSPAVAELAGGGYVVVWESNHTVSTSVGESTSWAQLYNADGEKVGSEFQVDGSDAVVGLEDGSFVVAWQDGDIFARQYDALGNREGGQITVSGDYANPTIAALNGGGFVVTWNGNARMFDADGKPTSDEISIYSGNTTGTKAIALDDGGFMAVFTNSYYTGYGNDIFVRFFNENGVATSSRIAVNAGHRTGEQSQPDVTQLTNGNFVITWETDQSELSYQNTEIMGRIISSSGSRIGSEFQVNTNTANDQSSSKVIALPDGGFIVAWVSLDLSLDGSDSALAAQRFDESGNRIGDEFVLNTGSNGSQTDVDIVMLNTMFAAVWESGDTTRDGSLESISSQLFAFNMETTDINGTDSGDSLTGTDGSDIIEAGSGNDVVSGGIGNDHISGGTGNDVLRGDKGDDTVEGGAGADAIWAGAGDKGHDRLWGGDGNDTIGGGKGGDLAVGGAGRDYLFGGAGDDTLVGGDWDGSTTDPSETAANQMWGGDGNDVIYGANGGESMGGGLGDDKIYGGGGNDIIYAGIEGYDTLDGGNGNDLIFASYGHDVVEGGAGNDEIYAGSGNDYVNGGAGDDSIYGGQGVDTLIGGAGNDTIRPGDTTDILIFAAGSGDDVVYGFNTDEDTLNLEDSTTDFGSSNDVIAAATETADGVLIDLGGGDSLLLAGLSLTDLNTVAFDL